MSGRTQVPQEPQGAAPAEAPFESLEEDELDARKAVGVADF